MYDASTDMCGYRVGWERLKTTHEKKRHNKKAEKKSASEHFSRNNDLDEEKLFPCLGKNKPAAVLLIDQVTVLNE